MTRLGSFLKANNVKPARLAREAAVSRSYIHRLRSGTIEPTRPMMLKVRDACSRLTGHQVFLSQIFDLGDVPVLVTPAHGDRFAEEWYRGQIEDACDAAGVLQWPESGTPEEQDRHHDLIDEIALHTFSAVRDTISEAFVKVAAEILMRERSR